MSSSSPTWLSSENLDNPPSWEGVFNLLLDKEGVGVDVGPIGSLSLVDIVQDECFLPISNALSMLLESWSSACILPLDPLAKNVLERAGLGENDCEKQCGDDKSGKSSH